MENELYRGQTERDRQIRTPLQPGLGGASDFCDLGQFLNSAVPQSSLLYSVATACTL